MRDIDGNITVYSDIGELKQLQSRIYEKTGIPSEFQRLYFGRKLLTDAINGVKDIPSGSNIDMLINLEVVGIIVIYVLKKANISVLNVKKKYSVLIAVQSTTNIPVVAITILLLCTLIKILFRIYVKVLITMVEQPPVIMIMNVINS